MSELVKYAQIQPQGTLVDFMQRSPLFDLDDLVFEREAGLTREIHQGLCRFAGAVVQPLVYELSRVTHSDASATTTHPSA
ncbi:hypothetical protein ACSFA3_14355 [Variovorax sp. RHLX14]|uniref:hypothetical protein n=1 Tax=Variovorax sp. RHLX14 TaxID=1259731 RepID=UPI003F45D86E